MDTNRTLLKETNIENKQNPASKNRKEIEQSEGWQPKSNPSKQFGKKRFD